MTDFETYYVQWILEFGMAVLNLVEVILMKCVIRLNTFNLFIVQCLPLGPMEHGSVILSSMVIAPVIATYSCQNGYLLIGPKQRECVYSSSEEIGQWSGIMPACKCCIE